MMTSKERVSRAIHFQGCDRLPIGDWGNSDWGDFAMLGACPQYYKYYEKEWMGKIYQECIDEWGCAQTRVDDTMGGQIKEPLIKEWSDLDSYQVPGIPGQVENLPKELASIPEDKYVLGDLGRILQGTFDIRGMDNLMMDYYLNPDRVKQLYRIQIDHKLDLLEKLASLGRLDGVIIWDDWGMQDRLLVSPATWREFARPVYERLFQAVHAKGADVWFHSCGYVWDIIPDLIEVGVSTLQLNQPELFDVERLGRVFGGKLCIVAPVDIQKVLTTNDPKRIEEEAHWLVKNLWKKGGGLVAIVSKDVPGIDDSSIQVAHRVFSSYRFDLAKETAQ